jgi:hypothetical protein
VTRRAADLKLALALDLTDRLPGTRQALLDGRIDLAKARAIADHTANLSEAASRRAVEDRVLRKAQTQTTPELRRSLLRAVASVDANAAAKRHTEAKASRFLHVHPLPDGMAEIQALLPADDAMTVFATVDALAHSADPHDPRPVEARRADALVDICRAVFTAPHASKRSSHRRPPRSANNLGPLCRHHHRAKTEAGWSWHRDVDGTIRWIAPTGHVYRASMPPVLDAEPMLPSEPLFLSSTGPGGGQTAAPAVSGNAVSALGGRPPT